MWIYEKKLEYPVNLKSKDLGMAKFLMAQYGGPDGELSASLRYLSQRYTMPTSKTKGLLTDIGTEELAHVEIIATMVYQIIENASPKELREAGLGSYYTEHGNAIYPADANGVPWTAAYIQSMGDPITDLHEDMAAEQKARTTYEHLMNLTDDHDIKDVLAFLRQREVVHFQRFGEALMNVEDKLNSKTYY
ncbi:manganese catalase family protein [Clostridium botulinum]|uniref:manganese catalase family protein n=1 Tax=Clostridium botulinum TaxID=1491 RepID=UPI0007DF9931|nr:manganese catalase family protein [Clostridium botulinum]KEI80587.1 CotJC [Clostridium botulinum B2 331]NEZ75187.1 manganese catalase family protein [Clostridium botulinum]NFA01146.1 manganese catalase family protein [Clostridium botulinum]NFA33200.1 manganese catalase family protein [Clostridium botulinum]NFA86223.1 manganese catalase family protein [Clostridium botulinum]